jgi:hypothetical protein
MPDYYGVSLTIMGYPSYAISVKEVEANGGLRWEMAEIDFDAVEAKLADDLREGLVDERIALAWNTLRAEVDRIGSPEQMTWTAAADGVTGTLEMDWPELSYGTAELEESVLPALQALGLAFFACDDGKFENAGVFHEWRTGWTAITTGGYHSSTGKLLSNSEWTRILIGATSPEDAATAVHQFFDPDRNAASI